MFQDPPETVYDFLTNPANGLRTYPSSVNVGGLADALPLKVGDTWTERANVGDLRNEFGSLSNPCRARPPAYP